MLKKCSALKFGISTKETHDSAEKVFNIGMSSELGGSVAKSMSWYNSDNSKL
jgi:hypothetical protein